MQAGNTINQYKIIDRIGEGSMGVVYLAEDTHLGRKVALKFVANALSGSSDEIARFHQEARAAAHLNHPNICTVHELGEAEGRAYIAMEYVEGVTLEDHMQQREFHEADVLKWLTQMAEGLHVAHEAGVIHRDMKPANIMISTGGLVKIMDFGIARLMESDANLTKPNSMLGTALYMSPEQARGEEVSRQTDIWSIGVILYEMATGKPPFAGAYREAVLYSVLHTEPPAPSSINPKISADLERVILQCLQRDLSERYSSLDVLLDDLRSQKVEANGMGQGVGRVDDHIDKEASSENIEVEQSALETDPALNASLSLEGEEKLIGPYQILRKIGGGGMGTVYLASHKDKPYRQNVALKVLKRGMDTDEILTRFRSERQILAALNHPNIAQLFDGGMTSDGRPYFAMNYIEEGKTIEEYCDWHKLTVQDRLRLFRSVCNAVQYAHQNLIVHRDLKPGNILIDKEGTVQLLDFGIAKILNPNLFQHSIAITREDVRLMTIEYAAPEQILGEAVTTATDVYSLGVILYRLLSGHSPYDVSQSSIAVIKMICEVDPSKPSTIVRRTETGSTKGMTITQEDIGKARATPIRKLSQQLNGDLDNIILKALQKNPHRRYVSVVQFAEDIDRYLDGQPVIARKDTLQYRIRKFVARNKAGVASVCTIFALLVSLVVVTLFQSARVSQERDVAQREARKAAEISNFLKGVFEVSNPSESLGETVTAKELLDTGAERIEDELTDQPEIQAEMMRVIGNAYKGMGLYTQSEPLLERSVATRRTLYPEPDSNMALSLNDLGELQVQLGRYDEAKESFEEAIRIQEAVFEEGSRDLATTINNLAFVRFRLGDPEAADSLFRVALDMRKRIVGERSQAVVSNMTSIGAVMTFMKKHDGAEEVLREALDISTEVFEENHPTVTSIKNNLAQALYVQDKVDEAEPLFREVLATRRALYGDHHNSVAVSMNNLAQLLRSKGALEEAERLAQEGVDVLWQVHQSDHPFIGRGLRGLGRIQFEREAYEEAEKSWLESYRILSATLAEDHNLVAQIRGDLVELYEVLGRSGEADRYRVAGG